jgi:predicted Zn-dependent protease
MDRWTVEQGGLVQGAYEIRALRVAEPLIASCTGVEICVAVVQTERIGAFSWPNGHIFITSGLMDRLDNAELACAFAHEMGHLINGGKLSILDKNSNAVPAPEPLEARQPGAAQTLVGARDPDVEAHADAAGLRLLKANGIPPQAMVRMLEIVETSAGLSPAGKLAIEHRVHLLAVADAKS